MEAHHIIIEMSIYWKLPRDPSHYHWRRQVENLAKKKGEVENLAKKKKWSHLP